MELRLPGNHISDVTPLAYNDTINILDLSSNLITNMSAIDVLGSCSRLIALNLDGNPLTEIMKSVLPANIARRVVCSSLPSLKRCVYCVVLVLFCSMMHHASIFSNFFECSKKKFKWMVPKA